MCASVFSSMQKFISHFIYLKNKSILQNNHNQVYFSSYKYKLLKAKLNVKFQFNSSNK